MDKNYFALKLIPSRPTFAQDMSPEEKQIMQEHIVFWSDLLDKGIALVFGPVLDPKAVYGLAIISVSSEEEALDISKKDPASRINSYEVYPMMAVTAESKKTAAPR